MPKLPPNCDPNSILLTFPVAREHAGQRLDRFLQHRIPRLSRTRAKAIVKACARHPDGRRRRPAERVRAGETILIVRPPMDEPDTPRSYGVLYEDDEVLAVLKPPGLPVHPTATYHRNTLTSLLARDYGDESTPQIAHRLDRETSGIVVCGKTRDAEVALKRCFENRDVAKEYVAITRGCIEADRGTIDLPLGPAPQGPHVLMAVREDGAEASTRFEVLERRQGARPMTRVRLFPETGRQHQLRVHLSAIGHPIVGDKLYGPRGAEPFLELIDTGWTEALLERLEHPRHALHAARLVIAHPSRSQPLELETPIASDMDDLWRAADPLSPEALLRPRWDVEFRGES